MLLFSKQSTNGYVSMVALKSDTSQNIFDLNIFEIYFFLKKKSDIKCIDNSYDRYVIKMSHKIMVIHGYPVPFPSPCPHFRSKSHPDLYKISTKDKSCRRRSMTSTSCNIALELCSLQREPGGVFFGGHMRMLFLL